MMGRNYYTIRTIDIQLHTPHIWTVYNRRMYKYGYNNNRPVCSYCIIAHICTAKEDVY
jgi:hypothetical protein